MSYYEKMIAEQSALSLAKLGFDTTKVEQGSPEWLRARLGVISASRASDLIATGRGGKGRGKAYETYLLELVAEVATGQSPEQGTFKQAQWGHDNEDSARQIFAFHVGLPVQETTFIYANKEMRYGCSPDGIADDHSGLELKCPFTTQVHLDFLLNGNIKPEYIDQCQFSMFVTDLPYWHFGSFDPRMKVKPFHAVTLERDESMMKTFEDAIGEMTYDIDKALEKIGMKFGDQWGDNLIKEAA
jgi:hypothetical protein